jgi:putative phosphoribosyl transferase
MAMLFRNRREAGRAVAGQLAQYASRPGVVVLALPRGGVPVGFEVAEALAAPLDVFLVRKLGFPGNEEFAMGAIASGGVRVVNEALLRRYGIPAAAVDRVVEQEERELRRRERLYRGNRPALELKGRTAILVDDGLATGSSMQAAVKAVRSRGPERIVVAVPVGPTESVRELARMADEVACVATPEPFLAVGRFYDDFQQVGDEEVAQLLEEAARARDGEGSLTPA